MAAECEGWKRRVLAAPILLSLHGTAGAQEPAFELSIALCAAEDQFGAAGSMYLATFDCVLTPSRNEALDPATGWSIALAGDGVRIVEMTTSGTIADCHAPGAIEESTELTAGAGNDGAVSVVRLSPLDGCGLPAREGETVLARLIVEGSYPQVGEGSKDVRLYFTARVGSSGSAVPNEVIWRDRPVSPQLRECRVRLSSTPCLKQGLHFTLQKEPIAEPPHVTSALFESQDRWFVVDRLERTRLYGAFVSDLEGERGLQGWALSLQITGDVYPVSVTSEKTAAALEPEGLRKSSQSFERTELAIPRNGLEGQGIVSAVVLSFVEPRELPPRGTATVVAIDLRALPPFADFVIGRVRCVDYLTGHGKPVGNAGTVEGSTLRFCTCGEAILTLPRAPFSEFIRADANDDGQVDLADAISILQVLFLGATSPPCRDAADANDDGKVNIGDAVRILTHRFLGGPPPPLPYPSCGEDPTDDTQDRFIENDLRCPLGSHRACR